MFSEHLSCASYGSKHMEMKRFPGEVPSLNWGCSKSIQLFQAVAELRFKSGPSPNSYSLMATSHLFLMLMQSFSLNQRPGNNKDYFPAVVLGALKRIISSDF